jgi:phosphatidylglycerophosphatase A
MKNKFSLTTIIVTFFGVGFSPIAPGTLGSIVAFPLYFLLALGLIYIKGGGSSLASPDLTNSLLVFFTGLFFVGAWAIDHYSARTKKHDPKEVVIDEVVGQSLTICIIIFFLPYIGVDSLKKFIDIGISEINLVWINLFSAFVLFRLFDIFKPWPINYIDKNFKGGFGVMLDDVAAAIFASVFHYFIFYSVVDRL